MKASNPRSPPSDLGPDPWDFSTSVDPVTRSFTPRRVSQCSRPHEDNITSYNILSSPPYLLLLPSNSSSSFSLPSPLLLISSSHLSSLSSPPLPPPPFSLVPLHFKCNELPSMWTPSSPKAQMRYAHDDTCQNINRQATSKFLVSSLPPSSSSTSSSLLLTQSLTFESVNRNKY